MAETVFRLEVIKPQLSERQIAQLEEAIAYAAETGDAYKVVSKSGLNLAVFPSGILVNLNGTEEEETPKEPLEPLIDLEDINREMIWRGRKEKNPIIKPKDAQPCSCYGCSNISGDWTRCLLDRKNYARCQDQIKKQLEAELRSKKPPNNGA